MSSLNLARASIAGHICSDVELKTTAQGTHVCSFRVAVNRKAGEGKQAADYYTVNAWRNEADFVSRFFKNGDAVFVFGDLQTRSYEKNGEKRYVTEIRADRICFVDSKKDSQSAPAQAPSYGSSVTVSDYSTAELEPLGADDELPF